jgi:hypothetical protein
MLATKHFWAYSLLAGPAYRRAHATVILAVLRTRHQFFLGNIMNTLHIAAIIWGICVTAFVGLMVYRGTLTQHETDQLFLSETALPIAQEENEEIIRRVNFIQPFCAGAGGVAALMSVLVFGIWVAQMVAKSRS